MYIRSSTLASATGAQQSARGGCLIGLDRVLGMDGSVAEAVSALCLNRCGSSSDAGTYAPSLRLLYLTILSSGSTAVRNCRLPDMSHWSSLVGFSSSEAADFRSTASTSETQRVPSLSGSVSIDYEGV